MLPAEYSGRTPVTDKVDAERYRWLRDNKILIHRGDRDGPEYPELQMAFHYWEYYVEHNSKEELKSLLDKAIDYNRNK
jgi:hypothetical protein